MDSNWSLVCSRTGVVAINHVLNNKLMEISTKFLRRTFAFQRRCQWFQDRVKRAVFKGHPCFYESALSSITTTASMKKVYRYYMVAAAAKAGKAAMAATIAMAAMVATFETAAMVVMAWVHLIGKHEASQVKGGENHQGY